VYFCNDLCLAFPKDEPNPARAIKLLNSLDLIVDDVKLLASGERQRHNYSLFVARELHSAFSKNSIHHNKQKVSGTLLIVRQRLLDFYNQYKTSSKGKQSLARNELQTVLPLPMLPLFLWLPLLLLSHLLPRRRNPQVGFWGLNLSPRLLHYLSIVCLCLCFCYQRTGLILPLLQP
jgi:hypothetical protein